MSGAINYLDPATNAANQIITIGLCAVVPSLMETINIRDKNTVSRSMLRKKEAAMRAPPISKHSCTFASVVSGAEAKE